MGRILDKSRGNGDIYSSELISSDKSESTGCDQNDVHGWNVKDRNKALIQQVLEISKGGQVQKVERNKMIRTVEEF